MRVALAHRTLLLATATWLLLATCSLVLAACPSLERGDEIFELNIRQAGCTTDPVKLTQRTQVRQYLHMADRHCGQWIDGDWSQLVTPPDDGRVTIVHVHGNKVDPCMARDRGLRVYRTLVRRDCENVPIRFVILSWPATEVKGFLNDFRVKAARTRPVGWEMAYLLNQFSPESSVSLLGYSYGARIIGGATHLMAGGDLSGLTLDEETLVQRPPMRVAFIAAATHACWMGPRGYHHRAMDQIDQLMLLNNRRDPAMRFYYMVEKNCDPQAMGLCGPTCLDAEQRQRVTNYDCTKRVGRTHDLFKYISSGPTMTAVWNHLTYSE